MDASISDRLLGLWHSQFKVEPEDANPVPFLYYQSVGSLLYTRIFADLGINFRNLLHVKHETRHLTDVSACASARRNRLDCGLKRVNRLGKDKAPVNLETHIYGPDDTPLSVVHDSFLIRRFPPHDLNSLDSDATAVREMRALRTRAAELSMHTEGTRHCSMTVTHDMGRSYGKVSGDMNPPSWLTGTLLHCLTPITLPAAVRLPLATIGVMVTQIPCRHGTSTSPLQMPDMRLQTTPSRQNYRSVSCTLGGVPIMKD